MIAGFKRLAGRFTLKEPATMEIVEWKFYDYDPTPFLRGKPKVGPVFDDARRWLADRPPHRLDRKCLYPNCSIHSNFDAISGVG